MKRSNVVLTGSPSLFTVKNLLNSALLACALNISPGAWAQTLFWDVNDIAPGSGGPVASGIWDTTIANWSQDPDGTGTAATELWLDNNNAIFSAGTDATGPYTVILGAPISAGTLAFEEGAVTLGPGGPHLLTIAGPIAISSGANAIFNVPVSSPGHITKSGPGTLTFGADLASAQNIAVLGGVLNIDNASRLAAALGDVVLDGATLRNTAAGGLFLPAGQDLIIGPGNGTIETPGGASTVFTHSGSIGGPGTLIKTGLGEFQLAGANTSGKLVVNQGLFRAAGDLGFGAVPAAPLPDAIRLVDLSVIGALADTALHPFRGIILDSIGGAFNTALGALTIPGQISGPGALVKNALGRLSLSGNNSYQGLTILNAGTLEVLPGGTLGTPGAPTLLEGGTLAFNGNVNYTAPETLVVNNGTGLGASVGAINNAGGNNSFNGNINLNTDAIIGTPAGRLTLAGPISGSFGLTKVGSGELVLGAANTYSGPTTIGGGTLRLTNSSGSATGTGPLNIAPGATLTGSGRTLSPLVVGNGTRLSPGTSPGTLSTGPQVWAGGGIYDWEINDVDAGAGTDPGWDLVDITGGLTITASPGDRFIINVIPLDQMNNPGDVHDFNVNQDYTWTIVRTTAGIVGFHPDNFSIPRPTPPGTAFVVQTNAAGTEILLRFVHAPAIGTPPLPFIAPVLGANTNLTVTASGTAPVSFQWQRSETNLPGATSATLNFVNIQTSDEGSYRVIVSNEFGTATSPVAVVDVGIPPSITTPPADTAVCPGAPATFSVTASGDAPLSYQWRVNGTDITGATSSTFTTNNVQASTSGALFAVVVTNLHGSVTSSPATLTVNPATGATPLANTTACEGSTVVFSTTPQGTGPFTVVWRKDGGPAPGVTGGSASGSTLTISNAAPGDAGVFSAEVTGACGSVTNFATLTVRPLTRITSLGDRTVCPGTTTVFSTTPSGAGPFTFVWRKDGGAPLAVTGSTLTIANVNAATGGVYSVEVTGACNTATNSAVLNVNTVTTATPLPDAAGTCLGDTVVLSTTPAGTGPFTFVWRRNGTALPETSSTLTVTNVSAADVGTYTVEVTGACGTVTRSTSLDVRPITAVFFDFATVGQFTNNLPNTGGSDPLTPIPFEVASGGVNNSRALDLITGNGTLNDSSFTAIPYDFSNHGATLRGSVMFKAKAPTANNTTMMIGFQGKNSRLDTGDENLTFMGVKVRSTAQPALTFVMEGRHKVFAGTTVNSLNTTAAGTLVAGNWYRLSLNMTNVEGTVANSFDYGATLQDMGANGITPGANVFTIGSRVVNADLVNENSLFGGFRSQETAGNDNIDNIAFYMNEGDAFFTCPPENQTVLQGRPATIRASIDGTPPFTYQWLRNGTAIPGATDWQYRIAAASAADAGSYTLRVTGTNGVPITSAPAVLTVTPDTVGPVLLSAGSFDGSRVGVCFDEPLDPATATNVANYTVTGTTISRVTLRPDRQSVIITPSSSVSGSFTVNVSGVRDLFGNTMTSGSDAASVPSRLSSVEIGGPLPSLPTADAVYSCNDGDYDITAGGADVWGSADQFRFTYEQKTGDFDVKVRVEDQTIPNTVLKGGLMVRENLDPASRTLHAIVNPPFPALERYETGIRTIYGGPTTSWGSGFNNGNRFTTPPNSWIRLRRVGDTFTAYAGSNGVDWVVIAQSTQIYPQSVLVGMEMVSHIQGRLGTTEFRSYGDFAGFPGAVVTITSQPASTNIQSGQSATLVVGAQVTGAPASELQFQWQRSNGSGGFTNIPGANSASASFNTGPLFGGDSGTQYRVIVSAAGQPGVTSNPATVTVTDAVRPTVVTAFTPGGTDNRIIIVFSEPVSAATATAAANYVLTNTAGASFPVISAALLDPSTVVLTTGTLPPGDYRLIINNVRDLATPPNTVVANTLVNIRQVSAPLQPVVVEVFQDTGTGTGTANLQTHALFGSGQPTYIVYSNLFGFNMSLSASVLPGTSFAAQDNYGVRASTLFIPPTNGNYKFWIRSDDGMQLWMNTNGSSGVRSAITASSTNSPTAEQVANVLDELVGTKYLNFDETNTGLIVTPIRGASVVTGLRLGTANDANERDPASYVLEGANSPGGPWSLISAGETAMTGTNFTNRLALAPIIRFTNDTGAATNTIAYTSYRLTFPTVRNAATANSMQISEVQLLNAAGQDVTDSGIVLIAENAANNANYSVGSTPANSRTNITLIGGQPYYMEALLKEGTGGDGFSVMWTDRNVNTAPPNTAFIPPGNLAYPMGAAPPTPVIAELYTGPSAGATFGGSDLASLATVTNHAKWGVAPDVLVYQKYFAFQPSLVNTRFDNYGGRIYSYFVAPSNGLYKFYLRSDDAGQLYMNTNAVNSTDPAGAVLLGQLTAFTGAYTLVGQNIALTGGQSYYIEARWKEGTGGDGIAMAFRAQADAAVPPTAPIPEVADGTFFTLPLALLDVGPVGLAGISPTNAVLAVGQTITLSPSGLTGAQPISFTWLRDGVFVATGPTFTTTPAQLSDNGVVYTLIVSNAFSTAQASRTFSVVPAPPTITDQPDSLVIQPGQTATFSVTASGTGPFTYQWRLNATNILAGATNSTLVITNAAAANAGTYTVVVSNAGGSVTSQGAVLTVGTPPVAVFPWMVGRDDNAWPVGNGGGPNTTFVQEAGVNPLPGRPDNPEVNQQSDDDYYFAGDYSTVIPSVVARYTNYVPVGLVVTNEEGAERAFAGNDNELRYHFNLPTSLRSNDVLSVTFDALNLDDPSAVNTDPRYGIEIYFNGVLVQTQLVIRPPQLDIDYTTPGFTLASVNARTGPGFDNIVTLRGVNYGAEGGGQWMGIDYVQLNQVFPAPVFPWQVGLDDDAWPAGNGGGTNTSFMQENGTINPLPGSPNNPEVNQQSDNDYYFAGGYTTTIPSVVTYYGTNYTPVGGVSTNEEGAERAFAAADNDLRYHFNLPTTVGSNDLLTVTFDALNLDMGEAARPVPDPRYGIEIYFNGVLVQTQIVIRPAQLGIDYTTRPFTLASVNGRTGPGFDNIISLKGINYNNEGGGNWMGIDYVQLNRAASPTQALDFADAPAPYPTLLANDGARHVVVAGFQLGASVDAEPNGLPSAAADGDGTDENGVVSAGSFAAGSNTAIRVAASAAGRLDAWIDFNRDGDWADAGEKVFNNVTLTAGTNNLTVAVPASASGGVTFARLRFSTVGGLNFTGLANDGEVEDYAITITAVTPPGLVVPAGRVVGPVATAAGTGLRGEYWKRAPVSIPGDGATNPTNRIDRLVAGFGPADGTFNATRLSYTGNDLTPVLTWLTNDAPSFVGLTNNLDDGAFRFRGFLNITNPGVLNIGTTSDDGSRITIGGVDVINNDGSHGDVTMDTNVNFTAAGLYPIEITYWNGDWTSDGTGTNLNHSGNPDPSVHGGANFHLRVNGANVNSNTVRIFHMTGPVVAVSPAPVVTNAPAVAGGSLAGEYWKRPPVSIPGGGNTNPATRIDRLINTFGPPNGTFRGTRFSYTGNDLTPILTWLTNDAPSFVGQTNNLDDGAIRFRGFLNVTNAGTLNIGTTSDDGSRITIGGVDIINNDGSHGDVTMDTNVNFSAAGLYPIEITYFNGDWTSDGTGTNLNHSGNPDPSVHGGANFHLRVNGATITPAQVASLFPPEAVPSGQASLQIAKGTNSSEVVLSWPTTGWVLEGSPVLGPGATWTAVAGTPTQVGGRNQLRLAVTAGSNRFFRLRQQ